MPSLLGTWAFAAALAGSPSAMVADGIKQYHDGLLAEAVTTLEAATVEILREETPDRALLVEAHVYRGAALVGLLHEEGARIAFRQALALQPGRRLGKGEFPDRVVRVFEAARKGESGSVLQRPPGAVKKAGLGAKTVVKALSVTALLFAITIAVEKAAGASPGPLDLRPTGRVTPRRWEVRFTVTP